MRRRSNINSKDRVTKVIISAQDPLRAVRIAGSRAFPRYLIVTNTNNGVIAIACAH